MIDVARGLGKTIIAEYVENDGILKMLREIGVDYAQGYAIAKPQRLTFAAHPLVSGYNPH